ncbi:MFS transporter [Streptomyces sp. NPDC021224]|uniref:MFS transporter n=1 Tax=unclassified Streptomyces TaxID=2593676 RepID=UPI00378C08AA
MSETPAPPGKVASGRADAVVVVLAFAGIVVSLMQTLVIPLVPELPDLLHASPSDATWAVTATLLASAVATPVFGRLGDMHGKRRLLLVSLVLLTAGSVVCALSDTLGPMIVGRALQGVSSGVIPLGISIMRDELPTEKLASATAVMSASLGVGGALGLPLAALVADHFDWHVLFWVSAGAGAVATALVAALVPESEVRTGGRFDISGALGLSAALVCLLLGVSKGAAWGWASGTTLGLFTGGVAVLLVWGAYQLRLPYALVNLRIAARPQVLFTNLASVSYGFSMFAMSLVLPQLLQLPKDTGYGLGKSLLVTGLVLAPQGLVMMVVAPFSARITQARGPKTTLMLGAATVAAGYLVNIALMSAVWQLVLVSCIIGAGVGLGYGAMPALVMGAVPVSDTAAANSLNSLMRAVGTSVSSAVAGVVLAQMTLAYGPVQVPSQNGFRTVMAIGAGTALLALLLASFIPSRRPRPAAGDAAPADASEPAALGAGDATA